MAEIKLDTSEISQADTLEKVVGVARAVSKGKVTYQAIAREIGTVERQGRYYRKAAENLGIVAKGVKRNESILTPLGSAIAKAKGGEYLSLISKALLQNQLFQRLLPFLERNKDAGCSRAQLEEFLRATTDTTNSMIGRRTSTIIAWLKYANLVTEVERKYYANFSDLPAEVISYESVEEPLVPTRYDLKDYMEVAFRAEKALEFITFTIDNVARERATESHRRLTNLVAARVRNAGGVPKSNKLVDLCSDDRRQSLLVRGQIHNRGQSA